MLTVKAILLVLLQNNDMGITENDVVIEDLVCLTSNIYFEARSEPIDAQAAVAQVTLTRVSDSRYPNTVCEVVKATKLIKVNGKLIPKKHACAFSWYCDGKPDDIKLKRQNGTLIEENIAALENAAAIALMASIGVLADNTNGATHYYNNSIAKPHWRDIYTRTAKIGSHTFSRREPNSLL